MLYFLFGGSASGKSEYAEQLAVRIFESDRVTTADEDPLSSMRRMTTADEDPLSSMRRMTTADREPPSSMRRMTEADEEPLSDMSHGLLYIATMKMTARRRRAASGVTGSSAEAGDLISVKCRHSMT